jgi:hypothetical protein
MGNTSSATVLLYVAIAAFVFWRVILKQLAGSTLSVRSLWLIPVILLAIGGSSTLTALPTAGGTEIALLGADLVVLTVLGVIRGGSVALSIRDGFAFQKGTALTLILWLVTIGVRVGFGVLGSQLDASGPLTSASIWLSVGLSIGIQNAVIYARVRKLGLPVAADRQTARVDH